MSNPTKNARIEALIDTVLTQLMIKTTGDQVYLNDTTTVSAKIAEMVAAINLRAKSSVVTEQIDICKQMVADLRQEMLGDTPVEAYDTFTELAKYIEEHEDAYNALMAAVGDKANKDYVDGELEALSTSINELLAVVKTLGDLAYLSKVSEDNLDDALVEKVNMASAGNHTHTNKDILDDISKDNIKLQIGGDKPTGSKTSVLWFDTNIKKED